jgi:hypothetical protein
VGPGASHIVAEVRDPEMDMVIRLTGGPQLETLQSNDLLARMSLSAIKTPGVAEIFEEVLGFEGDEFYTKVRVGEDTRKERKEGRKEGRKEEKK